MPLTCFRRHLPLVEQRSMAPRVGASVVLPAGASSTNRVGGGGESSVLLGWEACDLGS